MLLAVLQVAASSFGLAGTVGARIGHGVATIEATLEMRCSLIWWWKSCRVSESHHFYPEHSHRLKLTAVFGREAWPDCTFVQFLMADEDSVQDIRRDNPGVPNVGGLDGHCISRRLSSQRQLRSRL